MKIIRRAKKSVSSLLNSRPRKKTIESSGEQCASSEAQAKLPQSRPAGRDMHGVLASRSERDGETDGSCIAWLCVGKRQSNPCIDWNLLYLQVPDETVLSLIIYFYIKKYLGY